MYFTNYNLTLAKAQRHNKNIASLATLRENSKKTSKINSSNYKAVKINLLTRK